MENTLNNQVKTKKRVADHGEVFTHEREVTAMLDLVKQETERIDSRFLEPACGHGNFLAEILKRKLEVLKEKYRKSQYDYERYAIIATSSIYGIDLLQDNVEECRKRLLGVFLEQYNSIFKENINQRIIAVLEVILEKNVVCGDALTMKDCYGKPIVFSEWSMPYNDARLKQKEYSFKDIFSPTLDWSYTAKSDTGEKIMLPNVLKDHPLINYMELKR